MTLNKKLKLAYKLSRPLKIDLINLTRLSFEQLSYINQRIDKSSFLQACPGSGKTEVIGLKGSYEINKWQDSKGGLGIVTFTSSAAKELSKRVKKFSDLPSGIHPHFIGTFDSWIHNFILQPFCHYLSGYAGKEGDKSIRIIEHDSSAEFLHNYQFNITTNGKILPIKATEYHFTHDWKKVIGHTKIVRSIIKRGLTTGEFKQFKDTKHKFIKDGFATYSDAEMLCLMLLVRFPVLKKRLSKRFPVIIIDECQDLSEDQILILEFLRSEGTSLHFVGDLNQSIYEFREVDPLVLLNYVKAKGFLEFWLTNNFRSNQPIVNITSLLIGNGLLINANLAIITPVPCILWHYDDLSFQQLPVRFEALIKTLSLSAGNCAILARGKSTIQPLRIQNERHKHSKVELFALALHCWCKPFRNTEDIINAAAYMGRFLYLLAYEGRADTKNQYCPDNFQPIEWRIQLKNFLNSAKILYPYEKNGTDITWSVWVATLKQFLQANWSALSKTSQGYSQISSKLKSPSNQGSIPVKEICNNSTIKNIFRTTTIHSVKGETLDAVLLISHKNKASQGGHYSHWLREGKFDEEHIRFAYVACSRPKHLLILATPILPKNEVTKLEDIGFKLSL